MGNLTDIFFDDTGLTKATLDPLARFTGTSHDSRGLPTRLTAPDGTSAIFRYDARGNSTQTIDPLGQEQAFEYEPTFSNLASWRDALGHVTDFEHDPSGNLQSTTYADGTVEELGHDTQGNLVRSLNRRGQLIRYTYRRQRPGYAQGPAGRNARRFRLRRRAGNLLSATSPDGATVMEYDARRPDDEGHLPRRPVPGIYIRRRRAAHSIHRSERFLGQLPV